METFFERIEVKQFRFENKLIFLNEKFKMLLAMINRI